MLQNNLDPEVAENPDRLVVYGGTGRAARWSMGPGRCCARSPRSSATKRCLSSRWPCSSSARLKSYTWSVVVSVSPVVAAGCRKRSAPAPGRNASSNGGLSGMGSVRRREPPGIVEVSEASSVMRARTSPPQPPVNGPSSTTTSRLVLRDGGGPVSRSMRSNVRRSITSTEIWSCSSRSAASSASCRLHRRYERHVRPLAKDAASPSRPTSPFSRPRARRALVLEEEHGVVVADGSLEEPSHRPVSRARRFCGGALA